MKNMLKYIPYNSWEPEAIEMWLSEQAEKGLDLVDITLHFAKFRRAEPREVRYRFDQQELARLTPEEQEYFDACAKAGWELVCDWGNSHVFRTGDENAVELQSDPELYLRGLKKLRRRRMQNTCLLFVYLVLSIVTLFFGKDLGFFMILVEAGFTWMLFLWMIMLGAVVLIIDDIISLKKNKFPSKDRSTPTAVPKRAIFRAVVSTVAILSLVGLMVCNINLRNGSPFEDISLPLASLPFPTLADIAPDEAAGITYGNESRKNLPAPVQLIFRQAKHKYETNSSGLSVSIPVIAYWVCYDELWSAFLAKGLEKDWLKYETYGAALSSLSAPGFDDAFYGTDAEGEQLLIVRRGKAVLKVTYIGSADLREHLDIFAEKMG